MPVYTSDSEVSISHSEFINNIVENPQGMGTFSIATYQTSSLVTLDRVMATVSLNEFVNNRVSMALIYARHSLIVESLTKNVFIDDRAVFNILYISPSCHPGLGVFGPVFML